MILRWLFFETMFGEFLLTALERKAGLAVVQVEWLAVQRAGQPQAVREAE